MPAANSRPIALWLLALSVLSVLPFAAFTLWLVADNAERDRATNLARIQQTTRALVQAIDERFESRLALLQGLATSTSLRQGRMEEFRERAREVLDSLPVGTDILVADRSGQQLMNIMLPADKPLPRRADMASVERVFSTRRPWISDLYVATSGRLTAGVNVPVFGEDGSAIYNLGLELPSEEFTDILRSQHLPATWFAAVLDRNGTLAGRLPHPERFVGRLASIALREGIQRSFEGSVNTPTLENVLVTSVWSRSYRNNWAVAVAMPRAEFATPFRFQALALAAAGLIALALSAFLAFLFGRPIATRLALLADRAETMASGGGGPSPPSGIEEIDVVRNAMDAASEKIREQESHLRLLIAELDHRVKNMLASVQGIAARTFGRTPDSTTFSGRLSALAIAHNQLSKTLGRGSSLRQLVEAAVGAHQDVGGRIEISGNDFFLNPKATQSISLTAHELMTNSAKYGALSHPNGRVRVYWETTDEPKPIFRLHWSEHGGPPVNAPIKTGFGTFLIEKLLADELDAKTDLQFRPEGVIFELTIALERVVGEEGRQKTDEENTQPVATLVSGNHVLVVEDETLVAVQILQLLSSAGIRTSRAGTVDAAEQAVATGTYDAAILDVNLHGHMIFPVARMLQKRGTPILFVTGYDFAGLWPQDLQSVRRLGKPINEKEFHRALGLRDPDFDVAAE